MSRASYSRRVAEYGILIALAMVLSYAEAMVPAFFAVPGMKLGLTNAVVLWALYSRGRRSAVIINILRIILVSAMFSNGVSFMYSLAGGTLSCLVMMALKGRFGVIAVSVCGGIAHNIGQILVAMALLETTSLAWYLLVLWFTGLVTGAVIGFIGAELIRRTRKLMGENDK